MVDLLSHHDLLHPDTINLLTLVALGDSESPVLVKWNDDESEWTAVVVSPALEGYCRAPVLRRIRFDGREWRHFPMKVPVVGPVHQSEVEGTVLADFVPEECGTWYTKCLWSTNGGDEVRQRFLRLSQALSALTALPGLSLLTTYAASLRGIVDVPHAMSCRIDEFACEFGAAITSLCQLGSSSDSLHPRNAVRFPSLRHVESKIEIIEQLIKSPLCFADSFTMTQQKLERLASVFDLDRSAFVGNGAGKPLNEIRNWEGRSKVVLEML